MICKNCNQNNNANDKFCTNCGATLGDNNVNTTNNTNSSRTGLIIGIVVLGVIVLGLLIFLGIKLIFPDNTTSSNSTNTTINTNTNTNNNTTDEPATSGSTTTNTKTKVVGKEGYGYITVPSDWTEFYDPDATDVIQYSLGDTWIITMNKYPKSSVDAYTASQNVASHMNNQNVTGLTGATVTVAGYTAYQVYGYYTDEQIWLVCWLFEAEDGNTHFISVEGPDRYSDYFNIPNTFKLTR